jgi:hypothetical protein
MELQEGGAMAHVSRYLLLIVVAMSVLTAVLSSAQTDTSLSHDVKKQDSADHGLVLTLSQDQTPEPPDSTDLKTCLATHPPAACALLTLTLKNEGKETILSWYSTCDDRSIGFALLTQDGTWKPLPKEMWVCGSTMLWAQSLPPGKSDVVHIRLAERSLQISSNGYALLAGPGPFTIRASWTIRGCVASGDLKADSTPDLSTAKCAQGTAMKQSFAAALSNKLTMMATPLGP